MILINRKDMTTALTRYSNLLIAVAILLLGVVGIAAFPSQSSTPQVSGLPESLYPGQVLTLTLSGFTYNGSDPTATCPVHIHMHCRNVCSAYDGPWEGHFFSDIEPGFDSNGNASLTITMPANITGEHDMSFLPAHECSGWAGTAGSTHLLIAHLPTPQPTATPAPTSTPSPGGASLTGTTSMSGSGNTAVQVSISSGSTSVTSDTTTPTPAPLYLRSAGATPFPSIPKYGTPIPTPSISTSQPYIMLKNPKGRYITTSEPVGTEINIVGGNFPGKSEIESMWLTPVDPPYGEPIDITPQTKYFDVWSLSYKYQKNQTDKSGVVNETIIVPDAPPGLYYIELTARKVLGTTAKTQSTLFRIPGDPDLTTPVPYAIPAPYPTSTPYPAPVQVRAQRNISFDTQTRNSMKYDIDFGPNKICSDDL